MIEFAFGIAVLIFVIGFAIGSTILNIFDKMKEKKKRKLARLQESMLRQYGTVMVRLMKSDVRKYLKSLGMYAGLLQSLQHSLKLTCQMLCQATYRNLNQEEKEV